MPLDTALIKASWRSWASQDNRARQGPAWMAWGWTLLFSLGLTALFTLLSMAMISRPGGWREPALWGRLLQQNAVVSLCIGFIIHALFELLRAGPAKPARVARWAGWQRTLFFSAVPMLGVSIGWPLGMVLNGFPVWTWLNGPRGAPMVLGTLGVSALLTLGFHQFFAMKARRYRAEQQATEAQLRLLQAQIEPHFLFNTLANVQGLIDADPARAKALLEAFTDYLRASLGQLRTAEVSLGLELETARCFLTLSQIRMGERLRWRVQAEPGLEGLPLPPLLVQPLIENAIHHGLERQVAGGEVVVTARREAGLLLLEVADDGAGLHAPGRLGGHGLALENIRSRLAGRWGDAAALLLVPRDGGGTVSRLCIPLPP